MKKISEAQYKALEELRDKGKFNKATRQDVITNLRRLRLTTDDGKKITEKGLNALKTNRIPRKIRMLNVIRTDTLEAKIALAHARKEYYAEDVLRELARQIGAPVRELEITRLTEEYKAVLDRREG